MVRTTLEEFQSSRVRYEDINPILIDMGADSNDQPTPGYAYEFDGDNQIVIEEKNGQYEFFFENDLTTNDVLEELEVLLYDRLVEAEKYEQ